MGQIAEALRANLREIVESDARSLRAMDSELKAAREVIGQTQLKSSESVKALLGKGTFEAQTVQTLKGLCKKHGIKGFSKLKKAGLVAALKEKGIEAPPRPLESFTKKELLSLVKQLIGLVK